MKTRLTDIPGTELPLILGSMRQITLGEMAAAVSNAGWPGRRFYQGSGIGFRNPFAALPRGG